MRADNEQLDHLRKVVALGEYRVDASEVAQAMLERIGAREVDRRAVNAHRSGRVLRRALTDLQAA